MGPPFRKASDTSYTTRLYFWEWYGKCICLKLNGSCSSLVGSIPGWLSHSPKPHQRSSEHQKDLWKLKIATVYNGHNYKPVVELLSLPFSTFTSHCSHLPLPKLRSCMALETNASAVFLPSPKSISCCTTRLLEGYTPSITPMIWKLLEACHLCNFFRVGRFPLYQPPSTSWVRSDLSFVHNPSQWYGPLRVALVEHGVVQVSIACVPAMTCYHHRFSRSFPSWTPCLHPWSACRRRPSWTSKPVVIGRPGIHLNEVFDCVAKDLSFTSTANAVRSLEVAQNFRC